MGVGRLTFGAALGLAWMVTCGAAARAETPNALLKDRVEEALAGNFIRPETAIWQFDDLKDYTAGNAVVCGRVNYESAAHVYLGFHRFYAIVKDGQVTLAQVSDPTQDPSGRLEEKLKVLCDKQS